MDVLLVEDERLILMMLTRLITDLGHRVVAGLTSAEAAIEYLERGSADFVLLDIKLEGVKDGVDVGRAIRDKWNIPFAFATAFADRATRDRAEATKPLRILAKPIRREDLKDLLESLPA